MFEFDAGKLIIIGIVALIVIGPKELPRVMRTVGQAVGRMRRLATEFQSQFMDAMREADMADLKAEAAKLAEQAKIDVAFNPVADVKASLTDALHTPGAEPGEAKASEATASEPNSSEPLADEMRAPETEPGKEALQAEHGETTPVTIYKGEAPASVAESAPTKTVEPAAVAEETPVKPLAADAPHEEAGAPVHVTAMPAEPAAPEPLPLRTSA